MPALKESINTFLSQRRIAVMGADADKPVAANRIYVRLRDAGYNVVAIHPEAETIEGDRAYDALAAVPGGVNAVVIALPPDDTVKAVHECARLGVQHVWMQHSLNNSVSYEAVRVCEERGIHAIPGGCPLMFVEPVDMTHRMLRTVMLTLGLIPATVDEPQTVDAY